MWARRHYIQLNHPNDVGHGQVICHPNPKGNGKFLLLQSLNECFVECVTMGFNLHIKSMWLLL